MFVDFLHRSHQKFWQLLPINPTEQGQGHSPYSSISSRAGNTLLISPDALVKEGLLNEDELLQYQLPKEALLDYAEAERVKAAILGIAWHNFQQNKEHALHHQFKDFCDREAYWLNDFALYMLLKQENESQPWFRWPKEFKFREKHALQQLGSAHPATIDKIKWLQFMFTKQWHELKQYCNERDVKLFGDLPFYVSYDSVDVWSHRDLFQP
jgi:4-alpha-glucanotransferase